MLTLSLRRARAATVRRPLVAFRARGPQFVHRQFAVAVLIELFQSGGGIGDFGFVNHAVVVCIERGDDGRKRRAVALPIGAAGTGRRLLTRGRTLGRISFWRTRAASRRRAFDTFRQGRTQFVARQFSVAVLVERF